MMDKTSSKCPRENEEGHRASERLDLYRSSCRSRSLVGVSTISARVYPSPRFSGLRQNDFGRSQGRSP